MAMTPFNDKLPQGGKGMFFRKMLWSSMCVLAIVSFTTTTYASSKSDILAKGAKKLNTSTHANQRIGKTIKCTWFKKNNKKGGSCSAAYKKDGTKVVKINGKQTGVGWWTYKGGKFCETRGRDQSSQSCGTDVYKLVNMCYTFNKDGSKAVEYRC